MRYLEIDMEEPEIRLHFDTKTNKNRLDDLKDSDNFKYKIVKDKCGYFKLYQKYKKYKFKLESLHFAVGDEKNGLNISVYETGLTMRNWHSYWKDVIVDFYKYFNNLPEDAIEDIFKLFQDIYGGVLSLKLAVMKDVSSCMMTDDHEKLMKRYDGWYYLEFDSTFWDAFNYDYFEKYLKKRGIFNAYWQYDEGRMWMFFKKMTGKKLELAVRRFDFLMGVQKALSKKISLCTKNFFDNNKPWEGVPTPKHLIKTLHK